MHVESLPHSVKVTNINLHLQIASVVSSVFYVHTVYAEIPKECPAFELLHHMLKGGKQDWLVMK